ncbi:MAG TPA: glycosyltransferase family 39 protein [Galbitalea sp.]|jgi:mannosyltransferase
MTTAILVRPEAPPRRPRRLADAPDWAIATSVGVIGFLASFLGSWNPSLWGDEAASVLSAERPLPSLFQMLGNVDAVHGVYYLFLHFWIDLFGSSPVSVRLPSAIGAGLVVAGVFVIGSMLASRRLGILAALICAVIPRMIVMGGEARSYALSTAVAVWLTVLVIHYVQRGQTRRRAWLAYALGLTFGVYLFLYLALLIPVHAVYVLASARRRAQRRRWMQAVATAGILAIPIAIYGYAERAQIAFLAHRNYARLDYILGIQWFGGPSPLLPIVAWTLIAIALAATIVAVSRQRRLSSLALLGFAWLVLPTALLLAINVVSPSYNLRYVGQSVPAAALLMATGILALRQRWVVAAASIATIAVAMPYLIADRGPYAYDNSDWRQVSAYVQSVAQPGEAVVFDNTVRPSRKPRLAMRLYPNDWAGLIDVQLATPFDETAGLWDTTDSLDTVAPRLDTVTSVLLFDLKGSHDHGTHENLDELENLGFVLDHVHIVHRTIVYTLTRGQS